MSDVLTSIEAIGEYMPYPPYISRERIFGYEKNLKRFKGTYNDGKFIRIKNLNGGVDRFPIITENYFKLITLKLQGLLLNEKPIISYKNDVNLSKILNDLVDDSGFWRAFLSAFRNFSALGTGILYLSCNEQGPVVNSVNPGHLFKIVDSQNIDEITCYILVQPIFKVNYKEYSYTQIEKLRVLYHFKGYYIEKVFKYNENGQILNCESEQRYETGLTDFAVFCFENCPPTDEVFGYVNALLLKSTDYVKQSNISQELVANGVVGQVAGFNVFISNNLPADVEFIAGHSDYCTRIKEFSVPIHIEDLNKSGKYVGASAVVGRLVYEHAVTEPKGILVKKVAG